MNALVKEKCLAVLSGPYDTQSLLELAEAVESIDGVLAQSFRDFVVSGKMMPSGYILSDDARHLVGIQYVVVRLLKKDSAIRYACSCASRVIPMLQKKAEKLATQLVNCIQHCLETKKAPDACSALFSRFQSLADTISERWHRTLGTGEHDSLTPEQLAVSNRPLLAADLVLAATSAAAPDSTADWLASVDDVSSLLIECEQINSTVVASQETAMWERQVLADLVVQEE